MMRNTFEAFKFREKDTFMHKLDPRVKLILVSDLLALSLLFFEPLPLILLVSLSIVLVYLGKSLREWMRSMKALTFLAIIIFGLNFIFTPESNRLNYAVVMTLRFLAVTSFFSIFFLTTSPDEFADTLTSLKIPYEYVLVLTMALRFVPTLARDLEIIYDAHRSRGLEVDKGNFIQRIKNFKPILITLFIYEIRRSFMIAEALEARAFDPSRGRTLYYRPKLGKKDIIVLLATLVFSILLAYARVYGLLPAPLYMEIPSPL